MSAADLSTFISFLNLSCFFKFLFLGSPCVVLCVRFRSSMLLCSTLLLLELRMLSCSVQTFAQRLKKHPFISGYGRVCGSSISRCTNVLFITIIIIIILHECFDVVPRNNYLE